jgi:hypothetical protein
MRLPTVQGRAVLCAALALVAAGAPARRTPAAPVPTPAPAPTPARGGAATPMAPDDLVVRGERQGDEHRVEEAAPSYVVVSLRELVHRPEGFDELDLEQAERMLKAPPRPIPRMPPYPPPSTPTRPLDASDAVALADLALARGDAFDAAAQYRALVGRVHGQSADYVRLQLARAYLALDERTRSDPTLRELASRRGPLRWAALVALADAQCEHDDASRVLTDLAPLAGDDAELLADHLIHRSPAEQAATLLVDKAMRFGECGYAFQALAYGHPLSGLPDTCREMVAMFSDYKESAAEHARLVRDIEFHRHLNDAVARWDRLARAADARHPDPESWVALAEHIVKLTSFAATDENMATVRTATAAALDVAIVLSVDRLPPDNSYRPRIIAVARQLAASDPTGLPARVRRVLREAGSPP